MTTSNFKVCLHHHSSQEREKPEDGVDKIYFKEIYKDWLSRCNQNKLKTVALHITHLMCSLVLLLTISFYLPTVSKL